MLRTILIHPAVWLASVMFLVAGCGPTESSSPPQSRGITIDAGTLPELGAHIGPLDEGRVEAAPPEGWYVPPRNSKFVVRFQEETDSTYPTILIQAEDFRAGPDLSENNVVEYADRVRQQLKQGTTSNAWETVRPIKIGSLIGVTYQRMGKAKAGFKEIVLERSIVETVLKKRKYTVELRTRTGTRDEYQPYLYAVAAGLRPLEDKPDASTPPLTDEPGTEEPAAEQSAPDDEAPAEEAAAEEEPAEEAAAEQE